MITTVGNPTRPVYAKASPGRRIQLNFVLFSFLNSHILSSVAYRRIFLLFLFALLPSLAFPASIMLKLTTLDGAPLEQAGAGQPFLLNVVVTDTSNSAQYPTLKGIDNLHVRQSGFQMNMVNGNTSVTYHYQVRIDTPGTYTLGPARITEGTEIVESNPISVTVGATQKGTGARAQNAASAVTLKLACDKTAVYVGQPINAQLSFYTPDPTTVLQNVIEPEQTASNGLIFKNKQNQPVNGTEKINGTDHRFAKWNFQIIPTKPGALIIPAYTAQYTSQSNKPMLSFFFQQDTKRAYSNTVVLDVQPLPPSSKAVTFIGTLDQFTAQANPAQARVGQGIVLSLNLRGHGDFDTIGMLPLTIPDQLKWYESKKYYTPTSGSQGVYTMEYIVQAMQPGTVTIQPQEFYYFDTLAKRYKTISTQPITLEITGTAAPEPSSLPAGQENSCSPADPLAPLAIEGQIHQATPPFLSWPWYWALLGLATLTWLTCVVLSMKKNMLQNISALFRKRTSIYEKARQSIQCAYAQKNYSAYYRTITDLFAARMNVGTAHITPEIIQNSLLQDGLCPQALEDWNNFYAEISQMSFYKAELDQTYYKEIAQKAYYWIDVLKQLPRVHL